MLAHLSANYRAAAQAGAAGSHPDGTLPAMHPGLQYARTMSVHGAEVTKSERNELIIIVALALAVNLSWAYLATVGLK